MSSMTLRRKEKKGKAYECLSWKAAVRHLLKNIDWGIVKSFTTDMWLGKIREQNLS